MSAAAAKIEKKIRGLSRENFEVINGDTVFDGALASVCTFDHGTSGNIGRTKPYAKAAGEFLVGYTDTPHQVAQAGGSAVSVAGDTSASPPPTAGLALEDTIHESVAVNGVTARTDWGTPVYSSTDNLRTDLTLTRPADPAEAAGIVWKFKASGVADVLIFGLRTRLAMQNPGQRFDLHLGHIDWVTSANGNIRTGIIAPCHARILSVYAMIDIAPTGSSGSAAYNLEIGGTNVTGGAVTISTAATGTKGQKVEGTAVTAENIIHAGDAIDVEAASVATTRTTGTFDLYARCERLLGL